MIFDPASAIDIDEIRLEPLSHPDRAFQRSFDTSEQLNGDRTFGIRNLDFFQNAGDFPDESLAAGKFRIKDVRAQAFADQTKRGLADIFHGGQCDGLIDLNGTDLHNK